ncbi:aflatoxin biosynthesis ketoreductase-like protein nor-1 [Stipitochalara longipes BDJ]|nr:aflatoxin biosynthesis ketoreductase-like protein nor-1 [Stipitochalara longipes BDJ]
MGLTYVITGANRGIGKGLTEVLIARPNTTIIAAVRDVAKSTEALSNIIVCEANKLIIVKVDATSDSDAAIAVEELKSKHGITKVDVLLSNAGLMDRVNTVLNTPAEQVRKHIEVNAIAPLLLLQAFMPLLEQSSAPKFLLISSSIGTLTNMENVPFPFFAYGLSKTAANYLVRKAGLENPKLITQAFNPGLVQTDMGNYGVQQIGMEHAPMTLEESVKGLIALIDSASLDKTATFYDVSGQPAPW